MSRSLRLASSGKGFDRIVEDVGEALCQPRHRVRRTVHLDRDVALVRERANVVDAVDVIGVIMSEKNCVHLTHTGVDQLEPELRRSIDEDAHATVSLDERADTRSLISRVGRSADLAPAADLGDTKTGSRAQKRELQTVSTFRRLVVPGMSNGTPAVTMMRSPLVASSRRTTTVLVRSIISS